MARSVNKVILLGNIGRDSELTYTPSGSAVCKLSIATSRRWKQNEEWQEETEWHNLVIWGKLGENINQYLTKGTRVYVEGRIKSRSWEKDGVKQYRTDIVVDEIVLCGGDNRGGEHREASSPRPAAPASTGASSSGYSSHQVDDIEDEDIPF